MIKLNVTKYIFSYIGFKINYSIIIFYLKGFLCRCKNQKLIGGLKKKCFTKGHLIEQHL